MTTALIDGVDETVRETWRRTLEQTIQDRVDGVTPEGFEPLKSFQYQAGSAKIEEVQQDPDLELLRVTASFRAKVTEATGDGAFVEEYEEGVLEILTDRERRLQLEDVDFLGALLD